MYTNQNRTELQMGKNTEMLILPQINSETGTMIRVPIKEQNNHTAAPELREPRDSDKHMNK